MFIPIFLSSIYLLFVSLGLFFIFFTLPQHYVLLLSFLRIFRVFFFKRKVVSCEGSDEIDRRFDGSLETRNSPETPALGNSFFTNSELGINVEGSDQSYRLLIDNIFHPKRYIDDQDQTDQVTGSFRNGLEKYLVTRSLDGIKICFPQFDANPLYISEDSLKRLAPVVIAESNCFKFSLQDWTGSSEALIALAQKIGISNLNLTDPAPFLLQKRIDPELPHFNEDICVMEDHAPGIYCQDKRKMITFCKNVFFQNPYPCSIAITKRVLGPSLYLLKLINHHLRQTGKLLGEADSTSTSSTSTISDISFSSASIEKSLDILSDMRLYYSSYNFLLALVCMDLDLITFSVWPIRSMGGGWEPLFNKLLRQKVHERFGS